MSAAMERPKVATYITHESHELPTDDHEDHTFCGMMFDVEVKDPQDPKIPVDYIEISGLSVRGDLGFLQVFYTPDTYMMKHEDPSAWTKCYEGRHGPSPRGYTALPFQETIVLRPNERCGLYVHSTSPGDQAIVYDDERVGSREDTYICVMPGRAHLSNKPFGRRGPWGAAWRDHREFVGRVSYGVKWLLWNPEVHDRFPEEFQRFVYLMLWAIEQEGSTIACLPQEVVMYTLNMCRWNWVPLKKEPQVFRPPEQQRPRHRYGLSSYMFFQHYGLANSDQDSDGDDNAADDANAPAADSSSEMDDDEYDGDYFEPADSDDEEAEDEEEEEEEPEEGDKRRAGAEAPGDVAVSEGLSSWETCVRNAVAARWSGERDGKRHRPDQPEQP